MGWITQFIDVMLHLDKYLGIIITTYGPWTYGILFTIVFLETGVVLTPFLPGDSLLFAAGAMAGIGLFNIWVLFAILTIAAILGDSLNYWIGSIIGTKVIQMRPKFMKKFESLHKENSKAKKSKVIFGFKHFTTHIIYYIYKHIINDSNISKTKKFFEKHGSNTIILARFVPIVRTFAPFLAGIGKMDYWKFLAYNVVGAILWVGLFCLGGYFFGNMPWVQENFTLVLVIIIFASLIPVAYHFFQDKIFKKK